MINKNQYGKIISENVNLNDYHPEDFIEVFYEKFRPWVKLNHGDEIGKYPMSLLIKKHLDDFAKSLDYQDSLYSGYHSALRLMEKIGKHIVQQGYSLPTLNKGVYFTEKYKIGIEKLVKSLDLPSFATITFEEESPFNVTVMLNIDFFKYITSDLNTDSQNKLKNCRNKLKDYFENFLGVKIGDPLHGELSLETNYAPNMIGEEEWVKNVLNKKIKKEIKELPDSSILHSVKYNRNNIFVTIKLTYKSSSNWRKLNDFTQSVKNYLSKNGYNLEILRID